MMTTSTIMRRAATRTLLAISILMLSAPIAFAQPQKADEFSKANTLLFLTEHLESIKKPSTLYYAYVKRGSLEEGYQDTIDMSLSPAAGGTKNAEFKYFTGARRQYIPSVSSVEGNPIISVFLQSDVNDMERRTGGSARYFQNVIKTALENNAVVRPVKFNFQGRIIDGTEIAITPYVKDPHRDQLASFAGKHYVFTLSETVPGEVYEMRTIVPKQAGQSSERDSGVLLEEVLTLRDMRPFTPAQASN